MAISRRAACPGGRLEPWLEAMAAAGVEAVQLREKDLDDRTLYELAVTARALVPPPTLLVINGRADVALAAGADGVHLPASGLPLDRLRRRFGERLLFGRSTHNLGEVVAARDEGADWVVFGPVFDTPGKGPAVGTTGLARAVAAGPPVLALGGVTMSRLDAAAAAGAAGVAAIRLFAEPETAAEAARRSRELFRRPPAEPAAS